MLPESNAYEEMRILVDETVNARIPKIKLNLTGVASYRRHLLRPRWTRRKASGGVLIPPSCKEMSLNGHWGMPQEPAHKRAVAFFDGQNLYHSAKRAFGYTFPNYDPVKLAQAVCAANNWGLHQIRFYTGVPDAGDKPFWNHFWVAKGAQMGRDGVEMCTRRLMYRNKQVRLPDGTVHAYLDGDEKGIDVRIAIDTIRLAHRNEYDVAILFCQDQDLAEVADEVRAISVEQDRWIKTVCAFPYSPAVGNSRGINKTEWYRIDRNTYDGCLDTRDYRPKQS